MNVLEKLVAHAATSNDSARVEIADLLLRFSRDPDDQEIESRLLDHPQGQWAASWIDDAEKRALYLAEMDLSPKSNGNPIAEARLRLREAEEHGTVGEVHVARRDLNNAISNRPKKK